MNFEGSEKKVEVVITGWPSSLRDPQFRKHWVKIVEASGATILSEISSETCNAYLLSESSLFVYDHKFVMITCGQTNLISGVECFFSWVSAKHVQLLTYERKNEHFPEDQPSDFDEDCRRLSVFVEGNTQCFGDQDSHYIWIFHTDFEFSPAEADHTLEILMHGLGKKVQNQFYSANKSQFDRDLGPKIREVLPGFTIDEYFFEPMGFSLNALSGKKYFTIHVTPQDPYSYASFETNAFLKEEMQDVAKKVIDLFEPKSAMVLFFCPEEQKYATQLSNQFDMSECQNLTGFGVHFGLFERSLKRF